jgi:hypothetical protein
MRGGGLVVALLLASAAGPADGKPKPKPKPKPRPAPTAPAAVPAVPAPAGYRVFRTIAVTRGSDGFDGRIELLQDERVSGALRDAIDEGLQCCDDPAAPRSAEMQRFCESRALRPLAPSVVRVLDRKGRVHAERSFPREKATLDVQKLYGAKPRAFSVTVNFGIGMGAYGGPITWFFDLRTGRLRWLEAAGASGAESGAMSVMSSPRTAWKLVPAKGGGMDVLQIACRPQAGERAGPGAPAVTELIYTRYHLHKQGWMRSERREPGLWEDHGPKSFPRRDQFP